VVRQLEPIEVRARLRDPRATRTLRPLALSTIRDLGLASLAEAVALQPGVVATASGLSVRGARPGESSVWIEGIPLDEPVRQRPMTVPLGALEAAELVTGAIDAGLGGALGGALRLTPLEPRRAWTARASWTSGAGGGTHHDRFALAAGGPVAATGWGVVAAAEGLLDDTHVPNLRSRDRTLGALGGRADNRLAGALRAGPLARGGPRIQVLWARSVWRPFDAGWSIEGWIQPCTGLGCSGGPAVVDGPEPGAYYYTAADHVPITDERRIAAYATWSTPETLRAASVTVGYAGSRRLTSLGGENDERYLAVSRLPVYGTPGVLSSDPFYAYGGDVPYFRREGANTWHAAAGVARLNPRGDWVRAGLGVRYEEVWLRELDVSTWGQGVDSLRRWRAFAPGGHAFAQSRWSFEGFSIDAGVRGEWFDPGPQAAPAPDGSRPRGRVTWSPRVGIAYPISDRDAFSFAYARLRQAPPRDLLHDSRATGDFRWPLGNGGLVPATAVTYDAALQHLIGERWSAQASVFFRDWRDQPGARMVDPARPSRGVRYESVDEGHAAGVELALAWRPGRAARADLAYTYMDARGSSSLTEGVPTGPRLGPRDEPIADRPLDWDARHTVAVVAHWRPVAWLALDWSTTARSGLPWTPREQGSEWFDPTLLNSRRLPWTESTTLLARATHRWLRGASLGVEVRNLFDQRGPAAATLDGYPHPTINTRYDDYGAFRTETGLGGAFWETGSFAVPRGWVRVRDPRLGRAERTIRLRVEAALP
jgi:hypothetical protein